MRCNYRKTNSILSFHFDAEYSVKLVKLGYLYKVLNMSNFNFLNHGGRYMVSTFPVVFNTSVAGSLLDLPDAFLVAFIRAPRADATSLAAFSNICCMKRNQKDTVRDLEFIQRLYDLF